MSIEFQAFKNWFEGYKQGVEASGGNITEKDVLKAIEDRLKNIPQNSGPIYRGPLELGGKQNEEVDRNARLIPRGL